MVDNLNLEEKLKNCLKSHDASSCIPPVCYSNEEILKIEKDVLFKKQWICIGHVSFLKKAGDYITKEILDTPVIIIRDKSKKIRVFANVCRHRSAKLIEGKGNTVELFVHSIVGLTISRADLKVLQIWMMQNLLKKTKSH